MLALRTNNISSFFEDFENANALFSNREWSNGELRPSVDVYDAGESFVVTAELPGVNENEIDIEFANNVLNIKAERKIIEEENRSYHRREISGGTYSRSMKFGQLLDSTKIEASYKNGLLEITLPKEEKSKPRKIKLVNA